MLQVKGSSTPLKIGTSLSPTQPLLLPASTSTSVDTYWRIGAKCHLCPFNGRKIVRGYGAPPDKAKAVLVGESPGYHEARTGRPFVGPSGRLLRQILKIADFDVLSCKDAVETPELESEVYITNAALCLPIGQDVGQYKTSDQKLMAAACCSRRLRRELMPYIKKGIPICALGGSSSAILVNRGRLPKIGAIRSHWVEKSKGDLTLRVIPTWHPAYILRQPIRLGDLIRDLKKLKYGGSMYEDLFPPVHTQIIHNERELWAFAYRLSDECRRGHIKDGTVCLDIETDNVAWWKDQILCYGLAWDVDKAAIVPEELVYSPATRDVFIWLFKQPHIKWLGHNFKFDCRFIRHQTGVTNVRVDYDSLIADYVVDENKRHGLKDVLAEYYDVPNYEADLVQRYLRSKNDRYSKIPRKYLYEYCAFDVVYTLYLWWDLRQQLEAKGQFDKPFMFPLMKSQELFLDMELHGMLLDKGKLAELSASLHGALAEWYVELCEVAGVEAFNPNSPPQTAAIMYDLLKMPLQKVKKLGPRSVAIPVRDKLEAYYTERGEREEVPYRWLMLYRSWKSLEKIRNSYVDNTIPLIDENDRVHPDVITYGTETGRISIRNPALQTIPRTDTGRIEGELWGGKIKQCYTAPPGYVLMGIDYSQAELRTAAALSNDPFLIQCYKEGRDIHGEVAEALFPGWYELTDLKTKSYQRKRVKLCVFGRLYLGTEYNIAQVMGCSIKIARGYQAIIDHRLGGLTHWEHQQYIHMKKYGYVSTLTNRRRRMPLITRDNADDARKASANAPVQGTASDLTLIAAIEVHEWLTATAEGAACASAIVLLLHDEIILEVKNEYIDIVARKVKEIMEGVGDRYMPQLPWAVDVAVGPSWGDVKDYTPKLLLQEG